LQEDGSLNRKRLSEIVFPDLEKRKELERITHPAIFDAFFHSLEAMVRSLPHAVVQADLPLLMELNLQPLFDMVVLVYAGAEDQIERLCKRESIPRHEALAMISSQMPIDKKLGLAHRVIRNDGSLEETRRQVEAFWADLAALPMPHGA
jgi:dephospho-CoA kinase